MATATNKLNIGPANQLRLCSNTVHPGSGNRLKVTCGGDPGDGGPPWPEEGGPLCIHCGWSCFSPGTLADYEYDIGPPPEDLDAELVDVWNAFRTFAVTDVPRGDTDLVFTWNAASDPLVAYNQAHIDPGDCTHNPTSWGLVRTYQTAGTETTQIGFSLAPNFAPNYHEGDQCGVEGTFLFYVYIWKNVVDGYSGSYNATEVPVTINVHLHDNTCKHIWIPPAWDSATTYPAGFRVRGPAPSAGNNSDVFYTSMKSSTEDPNLNHHPGEDASEWWLLYEGPHCIETGVEQCP